MTARSLAVAAIALIALGAAGCGAGDSPPLGSRPGALPSVAAASGSPSDAPVPEAIFTDVTSPAGLDFRHRNGMKGERWFVEMMGAGVALLDFDRDGDLDLFLVQSGSLDPRERAGEPGDRLFRNELVGGREGDGVLRFVDVTATSGVEESGYGMGVAVGDYDGDGLPDLYVTNWGPNELWRNLGGGRFERRGAAAGVDDAGWSVPAVFFDADGDGRLDLFVGNYVDFSAATHQRCRSDLGVLDYCGPLSFQPQPNLLYRNLGDGTFRDGSGPAGLRAVQPLPTLGAAAGDFDGDGRADLYVANDQTANELWRGVGGGHFEEVALPSGCALDGEGRPQASMGVTPGDFDGDGDEDLFLTHLADEHFTLYLSDGLGGFEDQSSRSGVAAPSWALTGFGAGWLDYDGDGQLDLAAVSGGVKLIPDQVAAGEPLALRQPGLLLYNAGGGRFDPAPRAQVGPLAESVVGRGLALGDVDNDGDTDLVVTENDGPVRLLRNEVGNRAPWLGLSVVERAAGRDREVAGAWVGVRRGGAPTLWRRVRTEGSYASASDPRLLYGLGTGSVVEGVEVRWPDGAVERWGPLEPRRYHTLRRGEGT